MAADPVEQEQHEVCANLRLAERLSRSKSLVSMRQDLLKEMSQDVEALLLRGGFPVSSWLYTLRPFMRMNSFPREDIERFLRAVAGRGLSVRDIELHTNAYFFGPSSLREAIDAGNLTWSLNQMKAVPPDPDGCSPFERSFLGDLETLQSCLQRVLLKCRRPQPASRAFCVQANLLSLNLLGNSTTGCILVLRVKMDRLGHRVKEQFRGMNGILRRW